MLRVFSGRRPARRRPSALARIGRFCARLTFVALALPTLRHQLVLSPAAEIEGRRVDQVLALLVDQVAAPR